MKDDIHPKVYLMLTVWGAVVFAVMLAWQVGVYADLSAAAHRQQAAPGIILAETGWDHGPIYRYRFTAHGRTPTGQSGALRDVRYQPGQTVTVYFDAADPGRNSLVGFAQQRDPSLLTAASLFLAAVLAYAVRQWRAIKRAPPDALDG